LGQLAAAAVDAARVLATFIANMTTDATDARRQNFVFVHTQQNRHSAVDPSFRNVTLNAVPDPRALNNPNIGS